MHVIKLNRINVKHTLWKFKDSANVLTYCIIIFLCYVMLHDNPKSNQRLLSGSVCTLACYV